MRWPHAPKLGSSQALRREPQPTSQQLTTQRGQRPAVVRPETRHSATAGTRAFALSLEIDTPGSGSTTSTSRPCCRCSAPPAGLGRGEREGWAYLITTETERANWQGALVDGYTVYSQIHDSLPDHVLAEVLQGRISSVEDAEQWWLRTLCHHHGDEDSEPVTDAVEFPLQKGYLTDTTRPDQSAGIVGTELGKLTTRLMVGTEVGAQFRADLATFPVPEDPDTAVDWLIYAVATLVPELAGAPVVEPLRPHRRHDPQGRRPPRPDQLHHCGHRPRRRYRCRTRRIRQAALILVARSPELFGRSTCMIAGLPSGTLFPILERAPRYFGWLAAQGYLGTIHPWIAIVAADLGRRVGWRRCASPRGAGRLLWMCEHMAGPPTPMTSFPSCGAATTSRGITAPDWPHATPPRHCQLGPVNYAALLRERTTGIQLTITGDHVHATNAVTGTLTTWTGRTTNSTQIAGASSTECPPRHPDDSDARRRRRVHEARRPHHHRLARRPLCVTSGVEPVMMLERTEVRLAWSGSASLLTLPSASRGLSRLTR